MTVFPITDTPRITYSTICAGFTLVELMVVMVISAILMALSAPSFVDFLNDNRVGSQSNDLIASLALARSEAISRGSRVSVCKSSSQTGCTSASNWNEGWIVFTDDGTAGSIDGTDLVLRVFEGNTNVTITPPTNFSDYVSYMASGISRGNGGLATGTITLCGSTAQDKRIVINSTGRPRLETGAFTC
jgi:type IV fimbrial biogenesis protein FimT